MPGNPVSRARRRLITLAAKRAVDRGIRPGRTELYAVLAETAATEGGKLLAYWQAAANSPDQFGNLLNAVVREMDALTSGNGGADDEKAKP